MKLGPFPALQLSFAFGVGPSFRDDTYLLNKVELVGGVPIASDDEDSGGCHHIRYQG